MNKLTKLMLASAVLVTSGFAEVETTPASILNGTKVVGAGGVFEIENADYMVSTTGRFELGKGSNGEGGKLVIGSGSTMEVSGGSLISTGEGSYAPKIELNGTLKISENNSRMPTVNLTGVTIVGSAGSVSYSDGRFDYDVSSLSIGSTSQMVAGNSYKIGTIDDLYGMTTAVLQYNEEMWVLYETSNASSLPVNCGVKWIMTGDMWGISDDGVYIGSQHTVGSGTDVLSGSAYVSICANNYVVFKKLTKVEGGESLIDLSGLRSGDGYKNTLDAKSAVVGLVPDSNCEIKLPVNCRFNALDLSSANIVSYTKYVEAGSSAPGINESNEIRLITTTGSTYGDYSINSDLGVSLPGSDKLDVTTKNIEGTSVDMYLANVVKETDYNLNTLKLWTDDLKSAEHAITEDTTYNFGFAGSKAVTISGTGVATFAGDNSTYAPTNAVTLPDNVAFAASKSLFNFNVNVESLEFKGGTSTIENTVASGKMVTTNVLNVGANHKVIVNGYMKLVGAQASE